MAHEIDMSNGRENIAYFNKTPWHGLGKKMEEDADIDQWRIAAGLDWEAKRSPVHYTNAAGETQPWADKHVLYRSDTNKPLSVVSNQYTIVQPGDALEFFRDLTESAHLQIETAGSLKGGKRIWALARMEKNFKIMDDQVAPYVMLATGYDGTMATIAKFTSVRVVCNNTIQMALYNDKGKMQVSVPHSTTFLPETVKAQLGLNKDSWGQFMHDAESLAKRKLSDKEMDNFLIELLTPTLRAETEEKVKKSKAFGQIIDLYKGKQIGGDMDAVNDTAWGALNATTQWIDHERGRNQDNRLESAWFGTGAKFKHRAFEMLKAA